LGSVKAYGVWSMELAVGGLGCLAVWHLPDGPVDPASRCAQVGRYVKCWSRL